MFAREPVGAHTGTLVGALAGALIGTLLAGSPVQAQSPDQSGGGGCLAPDQLPTKATFDNGTIVTVLERRDGKIRYETRSPDGKTLTVVSYGGLFALTTDVAGVTYDVTWTQDLAQFFPLKIGEHILADASVKNSRNNGLSARVNETTVTGENTFRIGECEYPVLNIDTHSRVPGGSMQSVTTRFYHPPSMLVLWEVTTGPTTVNGPVRTIERRVVRLE